jgi:hypothetical protein
VTAGLIVAMLLVALVGYGLGVWRTWAYARKLIHFGISLDAWIDYKEPERQSHGATTREAGWCPACGLPMPHGPAGCSRTLRKWLAESGVLEEK